MTEMTYKVHESNMDAFLGKVSEINRRLGKHGCPRISYEIADESTVGDNNEYKVYTINVSSSFDSPTLSGHTVRFEGVVSCVDMNDNDRIFSKSLSDRHLVPYLKDCVCDECHRKMPRSKYFIFSKASKENPSSREDLVVLGSSCAKNWFPFDMDFWLSGYSQALSDFGMLDEDTGSLSYKSRCELLYDLFKGTRAVSDNFRVYQKDGVTRGDALAWIKDTKLDKYHTFKDKYPTPVNPVPFSDMTEWLKEAFDKDDLVYDFDLNARSAFFKTHEDGTRSLRTYIEDKFIGIAVYGFFSAMKTHKKNEEKKEEKRKRDEKNASTEWFGTVGEKFDTRAVFERMIGFETAYGFSYILLFRDSMNHVLKWSTNKDIWLSKDESGADIWHDFEEGCEYNIRGTIKAHDLYNGTKQTCVTRCKVSA